MKNLVTFILVGLVCLVTATSCTNYEAMYAQKNSESANLGQQVYALQSELANANNSINNLNGQVNSLNQQNANLQAQLTQALNKPPQIQYVETPVYRDRYVEVPIYIPTPQPRPPIPPHPPGPRPPLPPGPRPPGPPPHP